MAWDRIPLGEVMRLATAPVEVDQASIYKNLGLYSYGRGAFKKPPIDGFKTSARTLYKVHKNQFVYSRLFAFEGAYAIIPEEMDEFFVSNEYPTFDCADDRLLNRFLLWYFRMPSVWQEVAQGSTGLGGRRQRVHPRQVLRHRIPLPPLGTQREVVRKLDTVHDKILERRRELVAIESEANLMLFKAFQETIDGVEYLPLSEVAPLVRRSVEVALGGEYPELGVRSFGKGTFHKPTLTGSDVGNKRLFEIHQGDLLFNIVFAWEGAIAVPSTEDHGRVGSHRFLTFAPKAELALSEFLHFYLLTPEGLQKVGQASPGGAGRNRTLGIKKAESIHVPVPAVSVQKRFVELRAQVEQVRAIRASTAKDMEALIPAMLHEIFDWDANKPAVAPVTWEANVVRFPAKQESASDKSFKEAVLVGAIVKAFHEDNGQPIGNFRLQKAVYFARRQMGESALDKEYLRKAAGPYNPAMRYSGGIKIATGKNWIKRATGKYGEGSALGESAAQMDEWIEHYQFAAAAAWVRDRFKYKSNDLWEALATIDYTMLALDHDGIRPTSSAVLSYIAADEEWRPKIEKLRLTEASIQNVMVELESLFTDVGGSV